MATKGWAIVLVVLMTVLTSIAQLFTKAGAEKLPLIFWNWELIIGLSIYGVSAVIFLFALKGGEVTILYPMIATSYIWVVILSRLAFGETLELSKIAGIIAIVAGITTLGMGANTLQKWRKS
ncbi:MAG: EamA family transporter [Candidatus Woesearchaeota archaeon]